MAEWQEDFVPEEIGVDINVELNEIYEYIKGVYEHKISPEMAFEYIKVKINNIADEMFRKGLAVGKKWTEKRMAKE